MTERGARLVTEVLPWAPVRRWVLSLPYRLLYQLRADPAQPPPASAASLFAETPA